MYVFIFMYFFILCTCLFPCLNNTFIHDLYTVYVAEKFAANFSLFKEGKKSSDV